mmetsp:Transcript_23346/g.22973  ORF Transcript_23346/g.22973 Transcript_23346/m.22973 type:complete len:206 (+) Transcript_23346:23-640(+)
MVEANASMAEEDQIYRPAKIVVIGDGGVGKTSLIKCYAEDSFPEDHVPTILDCYSAEVNIGANNDRTLALQIWDSAGQDDYQRLRPLGYANSDVFIICYAINDKVAFKSVISKWLFELRTNASSVPIVLVATKTDLRNPNDPNQVSSEEGKEVQVKHNFYSFVECSAKNLDNFQTPFKEAITAVLKHRQKMKEKVRVKKSRCSIL